MAQEDVADDNEIWDAQAEYFGTARRFHVRVALLLAAVSAAILLISYFAYTGQIELNYAPADLERISVLALFPTAAASLFFVASLFAGDRERQARRHEPDVN